MKNIIMIAGVAALAVSAPSFAKPGKGKGNPHANMNHGQHNAGQLSYYGANCPPGLAKKNNGCLPPGQA